MVNNVVNTVQKALIYQGFCAVFLGIRSSTKFLGYRIRCEFVVGYRSTEMMKIKVKVKDCWLLAKVKISSELVINTNQCDLLSKKYNYGFLKLNSAKKNKLEFAGPKGISLYERLKKPISEYDFFFIIEQLVDITQKLEKIGLSRNNLVLDLKYVFFNESTKELSFIYLPIATPHSGIGVLAFVEQVIYSAKPFETDSKYLSKFSYFIKKFNEFDADKVESYICHIDSEIVSVIKKVDLKKNNFMNKTASNISVKTPVETFDDEPTDLMADDEKTDLMSEDDGKTDLFDGDEPTDLFSNNAQMGLFMKRDNNVVDDESTCLLDDEATELFSDDDDKTDLFDEIQAASYKFPTLIRNLTEEVIRIDKPVFRIGKEENCVDYIVTNNIAISRSHADIISRGGKYFVFDLRSKNKSYINNRVLPAEYEVEIFNGDVLKLANEEFLFQV